MIRLRKRWAIPAAITLLTLGLSAWTVVRGTWASAEVRDPSSSEEGIVRQLHLLPGGGKAVRSSIVLDRPIGDVWRVVSDYESFDEVFGRLESVESEAKPGGEVELRGVAVVPFAGEFEFGSTIRHETSDERRVASWDEPGGDLEVNRGSWTLTALDADRTLVVYALEVEVRRVPDFLVRVAMLHETKRILRALQARVEER